MMGHVTKLLTAYHHNELSDEDRRRVDAHVAQCERCRAELDSIGRVVALARRAIVDVVVEGVVVEGVPSRGSGESSGSPRR